MTRWASFAAVAVAVSLLCAAVLLAAALGPRPARGERIQHGNLIVSLDGGLLPLKLPRQHPAPVAVRLSGGLKTADGSLLPRVTRVTLTLPGQGVIDVKGLPICAARRLRNATSAGALEACGSALVGRGTLEAAVRVPHQSPFNTHAKLLAFNGRVDGRTAVLLHAVSKQPPTVVVLPFLVHLDAGRLRTKLIADLRPSLGPWPRFAHFEVRLFRRFEYRGLQRSYISAFCPIPKILSAGFYSFAQASFTLAGGQKVGTEITRSCRAA